MIVTNQIGVIKGLGEAALAFEPAMKLEHQV